MTREELHEDIEITIAEWVLAGISARLIWKQLTGQNRSVANWPEVRSEMTRWLYRDLYWHESDRAAA